MPDVSIAVAVSLIGRRLTLFVSHCTCTQVSSGLWNAVVQLSLVQSAPVPSQPP